MRQKFFKSWKDKTVKQIEKELKSWRKYMDKHNAAYTIIGGAMTPPNSLADGDKVAILRDILNNCKKEDSDPCEFCDCWKMARACCS